MNKKLSVAFLALLLVPAITLAKFPDVYYISPYYDAIDYVQQKGIASGYPNGLFMPDLPINRAEFIKILVKTKYSDSEINACKTPGFNDVAAGQWYVPFVCMGKQKGIITGYPDGTFKPANNINFAESAKIIRNTMLSNEQLASGFTQWYEPYVNALAIHRDIPVEINGFDIQISRGQMAEMIYRLDAGITSKTSLELNEINDRGLIEKYYGYISNGQYADAYNLKVDPGMTLDEFKKMYENFPYNGIVKYAKTAPSTYEFELMTFPNIIAGAEKTASERYKVKMQVIDGKLKTISSTKVNQEVLEEVNGTGGNASLEWDNGVYKIFMWINGTKTLAAEHDTKDSISLSIKNLAFSPAWKYLTYEVLDWESSGVFIYDIANKQESSPVVGLEVFGFTGDDKHFYYCSVSGMSGGVVGVIDLPGFGNVHNIADDNQNISSCGPFNESTKTLNYQITASNGTVQNLSYTIKD